MKSIHWSQAIPKVKERSITVLPAQKTIEEAWFAESITDFDLWLILDGSADLRLKEGETVRIGRGSCLWLAPGSLFSLRVCDGCTLTTAWLHFDLLDEEGNLIPPSQVVRPPELCEIFNMAYFESAVRHLILLWREHKFNNRPLNPELLQQESHLLKSLLYEYEITHQQQQSLESTGIGKHHHQMVSSALSWIYSHPEQVVSAGALAEKFGYSLKHFTRIFRGVTGKTPTQALIQARIDQAKILLSGSELNITEIADSLLYDNVFYFSKQFKQIIGVSPQQYRQQILKEPGG